MSKKLPRYPVYIPSKGRYKQPYTIKSFQKDEVPIYVVVQPQELELYKEHCSGPNTTFLTLPFSNPVDEEGNPCGLLATRNWIREHSIEELGAKRHWQFDDNCMGFLRYHNGRKIPITADIPLVVAEDFSDQYENVAITGIEYDTFALRGKVKTPFILNGRVYSASLINNKTGIKWRERYNDDVDICLQALSTGYWCTVLVRAFVIKKLRTGVVKGGNTDDLYQDDGRNLMARSLERVWPHTVETKRRFGRPQHVVAYAWRHFDNPLIRKQNPNKIPDYGIKLTGTTESKSLKRAMNL